MKVSVIIPTFNRAHLLPETLDSILRQTYGDFEVLVIDNCSSDNTEAVVGEYIAQDARIQYFKHPNHGVIAVNRNFGMERAQGEYIALCDDDDLWHPNKLEAQLHEFTRNPDLLLVSTVGMSFPGPPKVYRLVKKTCRLSFADLIMGNRVMNSSTLFRREVIDRVGYLDISPELRAVEDYDYWLRILAERDKSLLILAEPYLYYRVHTGAISVVGAFSIAQYRQLCIIFDKYKKINPNLVARARRNYLYKLREFQIRSRILGEKKSIRGALKLTKEGFSPIQRIRLLASYILREKFPLASVLLK